LHPKLEIKVEHWGWSGG
jgi:hypothetical protein